MLRVLLNDLLKAGVKWNWSAKHKNRFEKIKIHYLILVVNTLQYRNRRHCNIRCLYIMRKREFKSSGSFFTLDREEMLSS